MTRTWLQGGKLIKNFFYLSGAEVVSKLVTFVAIAYLARVSGPVSYGYVEFASAVMLCASLLVDQGLGPYGAREIAKEPGLTSVLASDIVLVRCGLALLAYLLLLAFALSLDRPPIVSQLLLVYGLSLLVSPFLLQWVFQGHGRMGTVAIMQLIRQTLFAIVVLGFVRTASQVWMAGVAEFVGAGGAASLGFWAYRRLGGTFRWKLVMLRQLLTQGVPIGLSQTFWMVRMYGATALVGLIAPPQDVAFFGAAMRILIAAHTFVWLYYFNLLPSMTRSWQRRDGSFGTLVANSLRGVSWAAAAGGLAWVALAPTITVAVYGPDFGAAGAALQWLAGVWGVAALSGHYRFGLIAAGHQTVEMWVSALGAVVALALIPLGYANGGAAGAAAGLVVAELVVWGGSWAFAKSRLSLTGHAWILARPSIPLMLTAVLAFGLPWPSPSFRLLVAMVVLGAQAWFLDPTVRQQSRALAVISMSWIRDYRRSRTQQTAGQQLSAQEKMR